MSAVAGIPEPGGLKGTGPLQRSSGGRIVAQARAAGVAARPFWKNPGKIMEKNPWDAVLAFWFGDGSDPASSIAAHTRLWWSGDAGCDALIRSQWSGTREDAAAGRLDGWAATPRGRLALIIALDQFSRSLYRGDARAFELDPRARALCREGLDAGAASALHPLERVFFYMPLEHSEAMSDQGRSVALFEALCDEVAAPLRKDFGNFLDFARRHRDAIARFGRFPGRNAALGRLSTPEELEFLKQPGSSF